MKKMGPSLVNERFGNLTVLEFEGMDKHHHSLWLCQCDCGNQIVVSRSHLTSGNTSSCGCRKRMTRYEDISGERFGRLTVIRFDHINVRHQSCWLCQCDCGNQIVVQASSLHSGNTASCGCYKKDRARETKTTHGLTGTRIYRVWQNMQNRCTNEKCEAYHRYGGRDISVCDEWNEFENFRDWANDSGYSVELSLDRIDNDKGYSPENCRWADQRTQSNNRSSNNVVEFHGIRHTVAEWARLFRVPYTTLQSRLRKGNMCDFIKYFDEQNTV